MKQGGEKAGEQAGKQTCSLAGQAGRVSRTQASKHTRGSSSARLGTLKKPGTVTITVVGCHRLAPQRTVARLDLLLGKVGLGAAVHPGGVAPRGVAAHETLHASTCNTTAHSNTPT